LVIRVGIRGRGGWGWQPALGRGKGVGGEQAIGAGSFSGGDLRTLHVHCVFFGKLPKEGSVEAAADASLDPGLDLVNVNQG